MYVRTRDAAVEDVAENGDLEAVDLAFVLADRHRVEKGLRRMLVRAVPGVDDRGTADLGNLVRQAGRLRSDKKSKVFTLLQTNRPAFQKCRRLRCRRSL